MLFEYVKSQKVKVKTHHQGSCLLSAEHVILLNKNHDSCFNLPDLSNILMNVNSISSPA